MNFPRLPCQAVDCEREGRMIVFGAAADSARRGRAALCMEHSTAFYEGGEVVILPIRMEATLNPSEGEAFVIDSPIGGGALLAG